MGAALQLRGITGSLAVLLTACLLAAVGAAVGAAAEQLEAVCRLELVGLGTDRFGLHKALLDCKATNGEPITISINSTHITKQMADGFTGVSITKAPCALTATNAFDFLEGHPQPAPLPSSGGVARVTRPAAPPAYEITVYPLICFHGSYRVSFEKPVIRDVSLDYMKAAGEAWSTAVLAFQEAVEATVLQATITNNRAGSSLVAVDNAALLLRDESLVEGSFSIVGGAVAAWGEARVAIEDGTTLRGNTARKGGAVYVCGFAHLTISDALLEGNHAIRYGGALYLYDSADALVSDTRLLRNSAVEYGGAIEVGNFVTLELAGSTVMEGGSASWGGCIDALEESQTTVGEGTACRNNTASWVGGGASISGSAQFKIKGSEWTDNAARAGGAIYIEGQAILTIDDSTIERNRADTDGGGIWSKDAAETTIGGRSSVSHNYAALEGGGLSLWETSSVIITEGSKVSHNAALRRGGGAFALGGVSSRKASRDGSVLLLTDGSTISHNTAALGGGVRLNDACVLTLRHGSSLFKNEAKIDGGGAYVADVALLQIDAGSSVTANSAGRYGGGAVLLSNASKLPELQDGVAGNSGRYGANLAVLTTSLVLSSASGGRPDKPIKVDGDGIAVIELVASGWYGLPTPGMLVQAELIRGREEEEILGVNRTDAGGRVVLALSFSRFSSGDYNVRLSLVANVELMMLGVEVPDVNVTVRVEDPTPSAAEAPPSPSFGGLIHGLFVAIGLGMLVFFSTLVACGLVLLVITAVVWAVVGVCQLVVFAGKACWGRVRGDRVRPVGYEGVATTVV